MRNRPPVVARFGTVIVSLPSLGVAAAAVKGKLSPPSAEKAIRTLATLNGAAWCRRVPR